MASGVQACCCSGVPCESAGEARAKTDSPRQAVFILMVMAPHAQRFVDARQDTKLERKSEACGPSALERNPVSGAERMLTAVEHYSH